MKSFTAQPFGFRVHVTSCPKEFTTRHNLYAPPYAHMKPEEAARCAGMADHQVREKSPHALFLMYLPEGFSMSTLFHESLHMAHYIMEYAGSPIDLESTETQAYLMEYIAESALKKLA